MSWDIIDWASNSILKMPSYNNHNSFKRTRGKSCPAGVSFAYQNDIAYFRTASKMRKSVSTNFGMNLKKECNFSLQRRSSFSKASFDGLDNCNGYFKEDAFSHLLNYSLATGGNGHNLFCCKLANAQKSHNDVITQHTALNNSPTAHRSFDPASSVLKKSTSEIAAASDQQILFPKNPSSPFNGLGETGKSDTNTTRISKSIDRRTKDINEIILFGLVKPSQLSEEITSLNVNQENPSLHELNSASNKENGILLYGLLKAPSEEAKKRLANANNSRKYLDNLFLKSSDNEFNRPEIKSSINSSFLKHSSQAKEETRLNLRTPQEKIEDAGITSNLHETGSILNNLFLGQFTQAANNIEVIDSEDNFSRWLKNTGCSSKDNNTVQQEFHFKNTELSVQNLDVDIEEVDGFEVVDSEDNSDQSICKRDGRLFINSEVARLENNRTFS